MTQLFASRPRLVLLLGLGGLVILVGCSGSAPATAPGTLPRAFPNHSAQQIEARIARSGDTLDSFSARARVTMRSPDENQSVNARMRQRRADSLFMRFTKFGFEGARLLLTPDSIFYYDSRKSRLYTGPITAAQRVLPAPVASGRVFENMLGVLPPDSAVNWSVEADSTRYYLNSPDGTVQITVDPTRWRVLRYARTGPDGSVLDERLFSDFKRVEGVTIPHRVIFRRPSDRLMAMIQYEEIDLNPGGLAFSLNLPSGVPQTPFR